MAYSLRTLQATFCFRLWEASNHAPHVRQAGDESVTGKVPKGNTHSGNMTYIHTGDMHVTDM